jgi:hypothetical protein
MLFQATVTKWEGISAGRRVLDPTNGTLMILNSNRVSGLETRDTTKSSFYYSDLLWDYKEVSSYVECNDSVATIEAQIDDDDSLLAVFPLWIDNDLTGSTQNLYLSLSRIIWGYAYPPSPTSNTVLFYEGYSGVTEVIVNLSLAEVVALGSTGLWSALYYTIKDGDIWYKRETNTSGGYFILWYSSDAGVTWDNLMTLDLTETSVIIDLNHDYVHEIVGTSYQVSTTGGDLLYYT